MSPGLAAYITPAAAAIWEAKFIICVFSVFLFFYPSHHQLSLVTQEEIKVAITLTPVSN